MIVQLLAHTVLTPDAVALLSRSDPGVTDADHLAEVSGRQCYEAWQRGRRATATNGGYLANILDHEHESVLEHSSATFRLLGVGRSLLAQLTRHRHLSYSVLSQRYVDESHAKFIDPPGLFADQPEQWTPRVAAAWRDAHSLHANALEVYAELNDAMAEAGVPRKLARQRARSVLPEGTETKIIVSGNLRAWRWVIRKRYHVDADEEIRELAGHLLSHLRILAPASVQDMPDVPFGSNLEATSPAVVPEQSTKE